MSGYGRMLGWMKPFRLQMAAALLLGFLGIGANVGLMGTSGYLIAAAALHPENVLMIWMPIVCVRFFGLSRGVFRYLERLVAHDVTFRILAHIRVWLYSRLEPRGAELLEQERSADVLRAAVGDVDQLQHLFLRVIAPPIIALMTLLLTFGILARYDVTLGLLAAGMMLLAGVLFPYLSHKLGRSSGEALVATKAELYVRTAELISGLPELLANGRAEERLRELDKTQRKLDRLSTRMNGVASASNAVMFGAAKLAMWLVMLKAIPLVYQGKVAGVMLPSIVFVTLAGFEAVMLLPNAFQYLGQSLAAAKRVLALAGTSSSRTDAGQADGHERDDEEASQCQDAPVIRFDRVDMRYPDGRTALHQLSFELKQGQRIAIVGESGAGKSSILQLLLKLRPYQAGAVTLNGADWNGISAIQARDLFGVVSQQVQLFNASVLDNLLVAKPDATIEECKASAELAGIHEVINALPQGYHTIIGEWGSRFSGGERQRLGLARALLRDAPILLFDEPTTGLDPVTSQAFMTTMREVLRNRSAIWITHKLEDLTEMDHILVLHEGHVSEQGTHNQLMAERGMYWKLQHAQ